MLVEISKASGIGQRTIQTTLAEYKKEGTVSSPNKKKIRLTILDKVDEFDKNAIRRKIHGFWLNREVPTLAKMLIAINEDETLPNLKRSSFQKVLKELKFVYAKKSRCSALLEREDIQRWRRKYLDQIRQYRAQNRLIYYLDETVRSSHPVTHSSEASPQDKRNPQVKRLCTWGPFVLRIQNQLVRLPR